jgi:hypothetical protein
MTFLRSMTDPGRYGNCRTNRRVKQLTNSKTTRATMLTQLVCLQIDVASKTLTEVDGWCFKKLTELMAHRVFENPDTQNIDPCVFSNVTLKQNNVLQQLIDLLAF